MVACRFEDRQGGLRKVSAAVVAGFLFLAASEKALFPKATLVAIAHFMRLATGDTPESSVRIMFLGLLLVEFTLAIWLLCPVLGLSIDHWHAPAFAAGFVLCVSTVPLTFLIVRAPVGCGCGVVGIRDNLILEHTTGLARNAVLLLLCIHSVPVSRLRRNTKMRTPW